MTWFSRNHSSIQDLVVTKLNYEKWEAWKFEIYKTRPNKPAKIYSHCSVLCLNKGLRKANYVELWLIEVVAWPGSATTGKHQHWPQSPMTWGSTTRVEGSIFNINVLTEVLFKICASCAGISKQLAPGMIKTGCLWALKLALSHYCRAVWQVRHWNECGKLNTSGCHSGIPLFTVLIARWTCSVRRVRIGMGFEIQQIILEHEKRLSPAGFHWDPKHFNGKE